MKNAWHYTFVPGILLKDTNLIAIPEIVEVYFTNEAYDLIVKIYARNNDQLLTLIQTQINEEEDDWAVLPIHFLILIK